MPKVWKKLAGCTALLAALIAVPAFATATAEMETGAIMKKLHGGKKGVHKQIKAALKDVDLAKIAPLAEEYEKLATELTKNEPTKGPKDSWETLTKKYLESATDLNKAAKGEDKAGVKAAFTKLDKSCGECHKVHQD